MKGVVGADGMYQPAAHISREQGGGNTPQVNIAMATLVILPLEYIYLHRNTDSYLLLLTIRL